MARRIDISSDREIAALRSIRSALENARRSSHLLRVRRSPSRPRALEPHAPRAVPGHAAEPNEAPRAAVASGAAAKALGFAYLAALEARFGAPAIDANDLALLAIDALVFDRSALLALAHGDSAARHVLERGLMSGVRIVAPATVLLDPDAFDAVRDLGAVLHVVPIDAGVATNAARLLALARVQLPLDALTVACVPRSERAWFVTADATAVGTFARVAERPDTIWRVGRRGR